ncbi:MAG: UrcA family protein [Pseudomonadota bacterium]
MKKLLASLFACAAFLAPLAYSDEPVTITIDVPVDATLLETDTGAEAFLVTVRQEARKACAFETSISYVPMVDRSCVTALVDQAEAEFENLDPVRQTASVSIRIAG